MLHDESKLAEAHERLQHARKCLQRSYGPDLERARVLYGSFKPELSLCAFCSHWAAIEASDVLLACISACMQLSDAACTYKR